MKDEIIQSYIGKWKETTKNFAPKQERSVLIVGVRGNNIGRGIYDCLSEVDRFKIVDWTDRSRLDVTLRAELGKFPFGGYDTLVLCNGSTHLDWIEDQKPETIFKVVDDCLTGSILATSEFVRRTMNLPYLKYIVYIGSMAHRSVLNASAPYCAAKAGLDHFTRCMGWELTPKGYRVFCVHPSNTEGTPMTEATIQGLMRYRNLDREGAEAYWAHVNQMPRWLQPHDVAATVGWLVSGQADFLSGTSISMSGGGR
jgi:NAD(P)-dependent dehydrogenase (short-subunit alcohol dehydrogenase family)